MSRVTSRILAVAAAAACTLLAATQPERAHAATGGYVAPMSASFMHDLYSLPADRSLSGFVHFNGGTPASHRSLLTGLGLRVGADFERYANTLFAFGTVDAFRSLSTNTAVAYLERNEKLKYFGGTNGWATRVRVAQENVSGGPYKDAGGRILRGQGSTIVVVDSGLDAVHPDFAGRVLHNYKVVCPVTPFLVDGTGNCAEAQYVDVGMTDTDTTGGHGTHCAGIAAGSGASSTGDYSSGVGPNVKGTYTGAAPEANIIAYGVGEGISVLYAAEAFQHVLDNWTPDIKVISNSYGQAAGTAYDPSSITSALTKALVAKGTTIVYAAGNGDTLNNGGTGTDDRTSATCKDPTPGVICVANYDDTGTGSRNGSLDFSSSRGFQGHPETYPDVAAPGSFITATCIQPQPGQGVCAEGTETSWLPYYGTISGTSMATPHVAGAVALLAQADPTLTPAQIESLIQRTARKVNTNGAYEADPQNPAATTNFGFGAGLLDLPKALDAINVAHAGAVAGGAEVAIFDGYNMPGIAAAANLKKLTMQEATVGTTTGIIYRLTAANATAFGYETSGVTYRLQQDVDGVPFQTTINATSTGVANVDGGSGNAASVSRSGNVISFFVPYVQLGSPAVNAPIHNVSVSVFDNAAGVVVNVVPHPATSTGASAQLQPMFGKPFTVTLATTSGGGGGGGGGSSESSCAVPGLTVVTDGVGDSLAPAPGSDVRALSVAEPYASTGAGNLVFTLVTDPGRAAQPVGSGWYASFFNPHDQKVYGVRMIFRTAAPTFESYLASGSLNTSDPNASGGTDGRFADVTKPADANSNYDQKNGRITIIVPMSDLNIQPGDTIGGFNGGSTLTTNPEDLPGASGTEVLDPMPNSLGYTGSFKTYLANGSTCPAAAAPTVRLTPTSLNFGSQTIGSGKTPSQRVVFTNTWTQPLPLNAFATASQGSAGEYAQAHDCASTLAVGASCNIDVTFRPLQSGARNGTLTIISNNGRRSDVVNLTGSGVGP